MMTDTHYRDLLARETAHLSFKERLIRDECMYLAQDFARTPGVMVEVVTLKLMTMVEDAPRWLRILVARAAIEAAAPAAVAA